MAKLPIDENSASRSRLATTVEAMSHDTAATAVSDGSGNGDGDTVAQVLGRLAFWDRWAEQLLIRWRSGILPPPAVPDWYDDAINQSLSDQWRSLPVAVAGRLALDAAESVDREIFRVESPVAVALAASGQTHLVNRYAYRNAALDRIDSAMRQDAA